MTLIDLIFSFFASGAFLCVLIPIGIVIIALFVCAVIFFSRELRDLKKRGL